jgi:hypothetical protein
VPGTLLEAALIYGMDSFLGNSVSLAIQMELASDQPIANSTSRRVLLMIDEEDTAATNPKMVLPDTEKELNKNLDFDGETGLSSLVDGPIHGD